MPKKFPLFIDLTEKKVVVYGAGVIASRRVETLLAFTSSLTVFAPEASERVQKADSPPDGTKNSPSSACAFASNLLY